MRVECLSETGKSGSCLWTIEVRVRGGMSITGYQRQVAIVISREAVHPLKLDYSTTKAPFLSGQQHPNIPDVK